MTRAAWAINCLVYTRIVRQVCQAMIIDRHLRLESGVVDHTDNGNTWSDKREFKKNNVQRIISWLILYLMLIFWLYCMAKAKNAVNERKKRIDGTNLGTLWLIYYSLKSLKKFFFFFFSLVNAYFSFQ